MNTRVEQRVPAGTGRALLPSLLSGILWVILCNSQAIQCVAIEGGAAELTWSCRTEAGERIEPCADANITYIRLCWNSIENGDTGCRPGQFRDFDAERANGVTLFEITPGPTRLFVVPVCSDGRPAARGTFQVPPDIVRTVREGQVVTLDSLLIVVTDSICS